MRTRHPVWMILIAMLGVRPDALLAQATTPVLVKDLNLAPGPAAVTVSNLSAVGNEVYFSDGTEFWKSDGTPTGTRLVRDLAGESSSRPTEFTRIDNSIVIFAATDRYGRELWITDGTSAGTRLLKDINQNPNLGPYPSANPSYLTLAGSTVFFVADDGIHGKELWKTDGTEAGTTLVKDLSPGTTAGFGPTGLTTFGSRVLFFEFSSLGISDGTEAGTLFLAGAFEGPIAVVGAKAFIGSSSGLLVTDGTPAGTHVLTTNQVTAIEPFGGFAFFTDLGANGPSLFKTDGDVVTLVKAFSSTSDAIRELVAGRFQSLHGGRLRA